MVMGVSPILVIFGAIYHWYPKITGRMLNDTLGKAHFWMTLVGTYLIYLPMHYLGIMGLPRRYYAMGQTDFLPDSAQVMNAGISIASIFVAAVQLIFLFNLYWSRTRGKPAGPNPWRATTLEWQTPQTPPAHGNWGDELPEVYRWPYDYSVPGADNDFLPQNMAPDSGHATVDDHAATSEQADEHAVAPTGVEHLGEDEHRSAEEKANQDDGDNQP